MELNMRMLTAKIAAALAAAAWSLLAAPVMAAEQSDKPVATKAAPIYGSQLMTQQERDEYRAKMRSAKTTKERQALRDEHHKAMQERAKERGVTLPAQPPARGGPGAGAAGKGPGSGAVKGPAAGPGPRDGGGPRRDGSGPAAR